MAESTKLTKQQRKALRVEKHRAKKIQASCAQGEKIREKSLNYKGIDSTKYKDMTPAQMEAWVTKATQISNKPKSQRKGSNYKKVTGE